MEKRYFKEDKKRIVDFKMNNYSVSHSILDKENMIILKYEYDKLYLDMCDKANHNLIKEIRDKYDSKDGLLIEREIKFIDDSITIQSYSYLLGISITCSHKEKEEDSGRIFKSYYESTCDNIKTISEKDYNKDDKDGIKRERTTVIIYKDEKLEEELYRIETDIEGKILKNDRFVHRLNQEPRD